MAQGWGFFIYDTRDPLRSQTIVAEESQLAQVEDVLTVRLKRGSIQYYTFSTGKMSGLEFETYSLALADITDSNSASTVTPNSLQLLVQSASSGFSAREALTLHLRNASALYVFTMGLLAFFMVSRPNTMRGKTRISIDFVVLAIALVTKVIGTGVEQYVFRTPKSGVGRLYPLRSCRSYWRCPLLFTKGFCDVRPKFQVPHDPSWPACKHQDFQISPFGDEPVLRFGRPD